MSNKFTDNALRILNKRYLIKDEQGNVIETPNNMFRRVADAVAEADKLYGGGEEEIKELADKFYEMMVNLDFLPNSPTLMNAGRKLGMLSACFTIGIEDSIDSIFEAVKNAAKIHQAGGGTGFSFSKLRPKGDIVIGTQGSASGPISFMQVFNAATETIKQGGKRRGANMACLRCDHPEIMEFIQCKKQEGFLSNFNTSVAITDIFMKNLCDDGEIELINPRTKKSVRKIKVKEIFDKIVQGAWENGEPGIIFIDRINQKNTLPQLGEIEAVNPCGEQPLLSVDGAGESCNLCSINLNNFILNGEIDYTKLKNTTRDVVHFMDNIIDINKYPLEKIKELTLQNRKIGIGIMGFADILIKLGIPYNSNDALVLAERIMSTIQNESKIASSELAKKRGNFYNYDKSIFIPSEYMRNATTTTIAPTGTISIIAGCSSGIEPLFAISFIRKGVLDDEEMVEIHQEFEKVAKDRGFYSKDLMKRIAEKGSIVSFKEIPEDIKKIFVTSLDILPKDHIIMQSTFQKYVDNAISKTINLPNNASIEDVGNSYKLAWELGCKGITVYRDKSREKQVLNTGKRRKESISIEPRNRSDVTYGYTERIVTGCGNLYVTVNSDEVGPCEMFAQIGKAGGCAYSMTEAVGRLASLAMRSGIKVDSIIKQLIGVRCPSSTWKNGKQILSCSDGMAQVLSRLLSKKIETVVESGNLVCPDCGLNLEYKEGCCVCKNCGFSKC